MRDTDHVVFSTVRSRFECEVCPAYLQVSFPCSGDFLARVGREFVAEHRDCAERRRHELEEQAAAAGEVSCA